MKKVCLCGSGRFEKEFIDANRELTLRGFIVYSLAVLPSQSPSGEKTWYDEDEKTMLDLVHLRKIAESDAILVVGDGYIGESTYREILWAELNEKLILVKKARAWDVVASHINMGIQPREDVNVVKGGEV